MEKWYLMSFSDKADKVSSTSFLSSKDLCAESLVKVEITVL